MDPIFKQGCAKSAGVGFGRYRYCLMRRETDTGVKYQWRWLDLPPEAPTYEVSPEFDSIIDARKWRARADMGPVTKSDPHEGWEKITT